jgi:DNA-binding NarL/FixJ family response regulator
MGERPDQLVGRGREWALLEMALNGLGTGSCRMVQIAGEPGIGKTRLLRALHASARDQGYLVLDGRGAEFETSVAFGMVVDALDDYLGSLDPERLLLAVGAEHAAELAAVFPSLTALGGDEPRRLEAERFKAHFAVRRLLEHLACDRPVVLSLDDAHWADPASVELLALLLRRPPRAPVLLAFAHRPHQTPAPLARSLDRADREGFGVRIELGPLSAAEGAELLGEALGESARAILLRESGGNPFYLEQLARDWGLKGAREAQALKHHTDAPQAVAAAIEAELASLPAQARTFLEGASIAGDPFEPELAGAAAELAPAESLDALDELMDRDLIRRTDLPRLFRFRHPIVRRAVYQSAKAGWRLAAHARAAAELSTRGVAPQALAHHVESSATVGDEGAIALLRNAGCAVAPRAPAAAARWFGSALRLLPSGPDHAGPRLELIAMMAASLGAAGDLEASHVAVGEALALLAEELTEQRVGMVAFCAALENLMGRYEDAGSRLRTALADLPNRESRAAAMLQVEVAANRYYLSDWPGTLDAALAALSVARGVGDEGLVATAAAIAAFAASSLGRLDEVHPLVDDAVAAFDGLDDDALADQLDAAFWLGWTELFLERFDDATVHLGRGIRVSRATGRGQLVVAMQLGHSYALGSQGRLAEALEIGEAAVEAARLSGVALSLSWALANYCWIVLAAGDLAAATRAGEESVGLTEGFDEGVLSAVAGWTLAGVLVEAGEPARCDELILERAGGRALPRLVPWSRCLCYEILTRAELAQGDVDAAERWASAAEEQARTAGLHVAAAQAGRARAAVELARGDAAGARDAALEAAAAAERAEARVEAARSRLLAGAALEALGERDAAVEELEQARSELDACGAARYRDQATRELRRLGRRFPASGGGATAGELSAREQEVARLVSQGMTNRQVAQELVLSVKTVERHMENIFRKLDVRTRAAVAGALITHED